MKNSDYVFFLDLYDSGKCKTVPVTIQAINGMLTIQVQGYGEKTAEDGEGSPIMVEVNEGKLQVILWSDINEEDPTHRVNMELARESNRR